MEYVIVSKEETVCKQCNKIKILTNDDKCGDCRMENMKQECSRCHRREFLSNNVCSLCNYETNFVPDDI